MFLALNIFSNRNINFVVMSIMFVCVACSDLNSYGDDKSVNNLESENKRNPTLVFRDTVENNSSKNSSVKTILSGSDSRYTITSTLCDDNEGPSCAELPLGDD